MWISESKIENNGIDKILSKRFPNMIFFPFFDNLIMWKNMKNALILVTNLIILVNGIFDENSYLDNLLQKSSRFYHHR